MYNKIIQIKLIFKKTNYNKNIIPININCYTIQNQKQNYIIKNCNLNKHILGAVPPDPPSYSLVLRTNQILSQNFNPKFLTQNF